MHNDSDRCYKMYAPAGAVDEANKRIDELCWMLEQREGDVRRLSLSLDSRDEIINGLNKRLSEADKKLKSGALDESSKSTAAVGVRNKEINELKEETRRLKEEIKRLREKLRSWRAIAATRIVSYKAESNRLNQLCSDLAAMRNIVTS